METLLAVGIVLGSILVLCLLAFAIKSILDYLALRKGHDAIPTHYLLAGIVIYFSILWLVHFAYLTVCQ